MRHAVVLAGGAGTRLWPLSTSGRPKQLVPLLDGQSLLDLALERAAAVAGDAVWLATNADLVTAAGGSIPGLDPDRVVIEPSGRDTLAAVLLAVHAVHEQDPDAVVAVLTADHVITPMRALVADIAAGFALAESMPQALVTFGVEPDHAATQYGWLELGDAVAGGCHVRAFREKPQLPEAERMLAAGPQRFLWNSGMFVWRADTLLAAAEAFAPGYRAAAAPLDPEAWDALPRLSVDHGVMEPASRPGSGFAVLAVPLRASWSDVGSWSSFGELLPRSEHGNATTGRVLVLDAHDNVVASDDPDHLVALIGVDGLVVVHTAQSTLVCRAEDAQRVKELQAAVARDHAEKA